MALTPFLVPTHFAASSLITIEAVNSFRLCLKHETDIKDLGLAVSLRICISSLGPRKTRVLVLGHVRNTNISRFPAPDKWKLENVMTTVFKPFYAQLFGQYLIAKRASLKSNAFSHIETKEETKGSILVRVHNILTLKDLTWRQATEVLLVFMFAIIVIQSIIIMNLQISVSNWGKTVSLLQEKLLLLHPSLTE
jgi:hypothetical protein